MIWHWQHLSNLGCLLYKHVCSIRVWKPILHGRTWLDLLKFKKVWMFHYITVLLGRKLRQVKLWYAMLRYNRVGEEWSWRFILYCHHCSIFFQCLAWTCKMDHFLQLHASFWPCTPLGRCGQHDVLVFQAGSLFEADTFKPVSCSLVHHTFCLKTLHISNMECDNSSITSVKLSKIRGRPHGSLRLFYIFNALHMKWI